MNSESVPILVTILIWIYYSALEGIREAFYYDALVSSRAKHPNIHFLFTLQRLAAIGLCYLVSDAIITCGLILIFPFIHDGFYYTMRNKLNPVIYKKRFWDESNTSTAILEFGLILRITTAVFGLTILVLHIILNKWQM